MRELKIKPAIGKLYFFREDNRELLVKKYSFYYTGLLMCIEEDVAQDFTVPSSLDDWIHPKNPLYAFETYNVVQFFNQTDFFGRQSNNIVSPLYLTLSEINDMIEEAHGKHS